MQEKILSLKVLVTKMLEHDWLLTARIYGLISCFRSKIFDLTSPLQTFVIR